MGKSNYYDKMEWQDFIKVIITQKLHQISNWEFHNMLYGMSTIEIIENLIIENLTENRVIRRFGWPPTISVPELRPPQPKAAERIFICGGGGGKDKKKGTIMSKRELTMHKGPNYEGLNAPLMPFCKRCAFSM